MRSYRRPTMVVEQFEANEYIAACGEQNKIYKFKCDATSGGFFDGGHVYEETNGVEGLQIFGENTDKYRSPYHPCSEEHEAKTTDVFKRGYLTTYLNTNVQEVIIWTGANDNNTHCTKKLDMSTWETVKS